MFFSTAVQRENDGVGIAEDATNGGRGDEAWEGVEVVETSENGHAAIVTSFAAREKTKQPTKTSGFIASEAQSYPHESAKSLFSLLSSLCLGVSVVNPLPP
jgi:hypothetical protein